MRLRSTPFVLFVVATTLLAAPAGALVLVAQSARVTLAGNASPLLSDAVYLGPAPPTLPLRLAVGLTLRDPAGFERLLADLQDEDSARYHQFLTDEEFRASFAPAPSDVAAVARWLTTAGFTVVPFDTQGGENVDDHLVLDVAGTAADAQRAFGVTVNDYLYEGALHFAAPDPQIPADVAPHVVSVIGLDDLASMHAMHPRPVYVGSTLDGRAHIGSSSAFSPKDTAVAYDLNKLYSAGINGSGWSVSIATAFDYKTSDKTTFNSQWGLPSHTFYRYCIDGSCTFSSSGGSDETTLDVEWIQGTARGSSIRTFEGANTQLATFTDVYNYIETNSATRVISTSWGLCETSMPSATRTTDDNIFSAGNSKGMTWFAASGDSGSKDCSGATGVDYPASSPYVSGVGGTSETCTSWPDCTGHGSETGWSGSGGGKSAIYAKPTWQKGTGVPADGKRDVPDVALTADPNKGSYVYFNGGWYIFGGTSEAAPQWGGMWGLLLQYKNAAQGNIGAKLYAKIGTSSVHDITTGSNGGFSAHSGYDQVTGVGSYDADAFVHNW